MRAPLLRLTGGMSSICKKDLGIFAPALQKVSDPIQKLFLDKIREYKSKTSGGKLGLSPETQKELDKDKKRIYNQFNREPDDDLTKFPSFNFAEPKIEKINDAN